jgi:5-methylcytosine-specific restriction endonuclease McrA
MTVPVLSMPVLTLNRHWVPIRTTSVQEAIGLVCKGAAKIIEPETYEVHDIFTWNDASQLKLKMQNVPILIRSTTLSFIPPEVILLTGYEGVGQRNVVCSRRNLFKRDKYTCQYCGIQPGPEELTIDHIVPRSRGGVTSFENCVLACIECNKRKADQTVEAAGLKLRKVPKKPSWKIFAQVPQNVRRGSWERFLDKAYWDIELEP